MMTMMSWTLDVFVTCCPGELLCVIFHDILHAGRRAPVQTKSVHGNGMRRRMDIYIFMPLESSLDYLKAMTASLFIDQGSYFVDLDVLHQRALFLLYFELGVELRTSVLLGRYCATELYLQHTSPLFK